jgi:uncharacterized protein (TIRG00374 family)
MPLVGLVVFAVIVYRTGPGRIMATLATIEWPQLLWAPILVAAIMLVRGARWHYVIRSVGIEYRLVRCTTVWTIGFFASSVTPAKAGDAVRALYLRNDTGRPLGETFLTVFVDRLWDLGFILVAGTVSALVFSARYMKIPSAPLVAAGAILLAAAAATATRRSWMRALLKPAVSVLVPARFRDTLSTGFHSFYDALRVHGSRPLRSVVMALYTLLCWALIFCLAVYVSRLLSLPVGAGYIALIMPIVTLVELIPFSVAGLGTRDATVIYFFAVVGAGAAEAVGFSIVYLLIGTYLTALCGFFLWLKHPVRWRSQSP